ncbi:MAG: MotA/TolQ/ExbB proton channel family protein [Fibrobacter sp.]|nr:MotA/TolQ/ExbB proton channel family protein [Fibrobacter sp.]
MFSTVLGTFNQGGWIMWPILLVSIVVWFSGLMKLYDLWKLDRARRVFLSSFARPVPQVPWKMTGEQHYDRLMKKLSDKKLTPVVFKMHFREFLLSVVPFTNQGLDSMAALITVAPLLGLLGTVVGMIQTFEVITAFGVGNPALTAEGISVALLTTEAGLIAAFPGLLLLNFVKNRNSRFQKQLFSDGESIIKRCHCGTDRQTHV